MRDTVAGIAGVEVIDCDPALADTAEFCAAYGYAMDDSANAIVVIGKASSAAVPPVYAVCLVLATTRLDVNRVVRKRLGTKKASFAPPEVDGRADRHDDRRRHAVRPPGRPAAVDRRPGDGARAHRRRRRQPRRQGRRPAGDAADDPRRRGRRRPRASPRGADSWPSPLDLDPAGSSTIGRQLRTASTSISTFQRGSSRAATTTVVLAGRTSPSSSPWTAPISAKSAGVDEVHARPHDVVPGRCRARPARRR